MLHKLEAGEDISSIIKFKEKIINREDTVETATVSFTANEEKKNENYKYEPIVFANDGVYVPTPEELFQAGKIGLSQLELIAVQSNSNSIFFGRAPSNPILI